MALAPPRTELHIIELKDQLLRERREKKIMMNVA